MPKVVVIIQARMGSTRLPGKVLLEVCGKTLLEHQLERVKRAKTVDEIIVATTNLERDAPIAQVARTCGMRVYCGSENDVLDRYEQAAQQIGAETVVRLTADCPLMDPAVVDLVIGFFQARDFDYVSNVRPPTFPDGMDVEVFTRAALDESARDATLPTEREHVTAFIAKRPERFRIGNVTHDGDDLSAFRLTIDEPADWEVIRWVFEELYPSKPNFTLDDIINLLTLHPEIVTLNKHIEHNEGYKKAVAAEAELIKQGGLKHL